MQTYCVVVVVVVVAVVAVVAYFSPQAINFDMEVTFTSFLSFYFGISESVWPYL